MIATVLTADARMCFWNAVTDLEPVSDYVGTSICLFQFFFLVFDGLD